MSQKPAQRKRGIAHRPLTFGGDININVDTSTEAVQVIAAVRADKTRVTEGARAYLLSQLRHFCPDVLLHLAAINAPTDAALGDWTRAHNLPPWVTGFATATLELWARWPAGRGRHWAPESRRVGELIPDTGRRRSSVSERTVPAVHFEWFVKVRILKQSIRSTARSAHVQPYAVSVAVAKLAALLNGNDR